MLDLTSMRAAARSYAEQGWRPIPIPHQQKAPVIKNWQGLRLRPEQLDQHFDRAPTNIGILLGEPSAWLVDIDLDCAEAIRLAPRLLPETLTFGRASKRRSHHLFCASGARTEKFQDPTDRAMLVELRSTGAQTVFPPSTHESGEPIGFDDESDREAPLHLAAGDLRDRVARVAAGALLARHGWEDAAALAAVTGAPGPLPSVPPAIAARVREWLGWGPAPGDPTVTTGSSLASASRPLEERVRRARGYLARIPPAVSGAGGHQRTWDAALAIVRGFDLPIDAALELLARDYNPRCDPPWNERELRHKVESAAREGRRPAGYLLDRSPPVAAATAPRSDPGQVPKTGTTAAAAVPAPPAPTLLPLVRVADLPEPGPPKWLIERLWIQGAFGIVGAEPKSWKTYLTIYLGICVASGRRAFDRFDAAPGRVLVFSAEGGTVLVRRRAGEICRALDIPIPPELHAIDLPLLRLDDPATVTSVLATVQAVRPALLILDPLRELHTGEENDASVIAELLGPLRTLQRSTGCAVMVVHHMGKSPADGKNMRRGGQRLRGSSALHGATDSALYLSAQGEGAQKRVTVSAEHREAAEPDPFVLAMRRLQSSEGEAAWLEIVTEGDGADERDAEQTLAIYDALRRKIIRAIQIASLPGRTPLKGQRALRAAVGGKGVTVDKIAAALIEEGAVVKDGAGAYRLAPEAEEEPGDDAG